MPCVVSLTPTAFPRKPSLSRYQARNTNITVLADDINLTSRKSVCWLTNHRGQRKNNQRPSPVMMAEGQGDKELVDSFITQFETGETRCRRGKRRRVRTPASR